ncbi:MAG: TIGR03960 family B12-binding radical SAM protein [Anaerolineae bacterium]
MIVDERELDTILPRVEKPARYIGGEYNSVVKDWQQVDVKVALAFPDVYELGMSNLGLAILYDILNRRPDVLAERVYAPWPDMERALRHMGIPLYSLESYHALTDFDLIGISLPYPQLYTNTLTLLELGGLPLLSADRDARYPLIMAGGCAVYNPEPMADFIDFFVIGEGEEIIQEIVDAFREVRRTDRETQLRRMACIPGVYVPRFYRPCYTSDRKLLAIEPTIAEASRTIVKRVVPMLSKPVTHFVVPYLGIVFDRAAVEIQRGCTRGCRFCQAGIVYRPVRERPVEEIVEAVHEIVRHTGHSEVGLLSLSSTDYSAIETLIRTLVDSTREQHISLSLPSSRVESVTIELVDLLTQGRRTGFTFAPEAASDRLREVINKPISSEELLALADAVYSRGWRQIKLYFMIGQPTETEEDVLAIARLSQDVLNIGRKYHRNKAQVRVSVSTFVPQPHTPFQWAALDPPDLIRHKQNLLRQAFSHLRAIIYSWNDPQESLLEAALARGDRRVGKAILTAWQRGCRFDAWHEHFKPDVWDTAFREHDLDMHWYATRAREEGEVFPWDHIHTGVSRAWLWADWQAALRGEVKTDCRHQCYGCGILSTFAEVRRAGLASRWQCPPVAKASSCPNDPPT